MEATMNDIKTKEIINIKNGQRLGFVADMQINLDDGKITALIVPGPYKMMGIFGKPPDVVIRWENIETIGEDLIIVSF